MLERFQNIPAVIAKLKELFESWSTSLDLVDKCYLMLQY
jgi:hypothetical protein